MAKYDSVYAFRLGILWTFKFYIKSMRLFVGNVFIYNSYVRGMH